MKTKRSHPASTRLSTYSSLAMGATAVVSTSADAATVVSANSTTYNTTTAGLVGIGTAEFQSEFSPAGPKGVPMAETRYYLGFAAGTGLSVPESPAFRRATDTSEVTFNSSVATRFQFSSSMFFQTNGAVLNSSDNWFYAVSATDPTQRVWLQMNFGNNANIDFSIVKAVIPDAPGELTNAAAAAAVPEPSALVLLSLGATGLMARRRRHAA